MVNVLYICNDWEKLEGSSISLSHMIDSLGNNINPIVLISRKGDVYEHFSKKGVECIIYPFYYLWIRENAFKYYYKYFRYYRSYIKTDKVCVEYVKTVLQGRRIDIVHSNSTIITIGKDIARALGAKHIWHIREFLDIGFPFRVLGGVKRVNRLLKKADARIFISKQIQDHKAINNLNSYVIWNAIMKLADSCLVLPKEKYFLNCSAHLGDYKNTHVAVEAFGLSALHKEGFRLKLIGDYTPEYEQRLKSIADRYDCWSNIDLLGYQSDLKSYFSKATAFIMCSEIEGLGRVTVEAMFYGCPVIAAAAGGTLDFVRHNDNGLLYHSANECADLMQKIADNLPTEIIRNAQSFAMDNFSEENYGNKILEVYEHVLRES